jgi:hypothetical protein
MASWMNTFYMDDVQWKLPQLFYFTWELPGAAAVAGSQTACRRAVLTAVLKAHSWSCLQTVLDWTGMLMN